MHLTDLYFEFKKCNLLFINISFNCKGATKNIENDAPK